jgi:hypothetical protein
VFSPLVPPYGDDAATKKTRALVFGAITFLVGVAVARWTGLLFLQAGRARPHGSTSSSPAWS